MAEAADTGLPGRVRRLGAAVAAALAGFLLGGAALVRPSASAALVAGAGLVLAALLLLVLAFRIVSLARQAAEAARAAAEAANRAHSEFLASISHELRTPLNAVYAFAQMLRAESRLPPECAELAEDMLRGAAQSVRLVEDLLDFATLETGHVRVADEIVDTGPVASEAIALLRPRARAAGIDLLCEGGAGFPTVRADALRLRQVLMNLISNGIKYNRPGGFVRVAAGPAPGDPAWARLSVRDNGGGIPPGREAELFEPFRRLAPDAAAEGSGLGLSICRQFVALMNGRIGCSALPGGGSDFWVELPRAAPAVQASPAPAEAAALRRSAPALRILYIEDNALNVAVMKHFIAGQPGCALVAAATGEAGVALARAHRPDVILVDLHLPDIDGYEVLRRLRAAPETAAIPVAAVTADALPADVARARAAGFAWHIAKPFQLDRVRAVLEQVARLPAPGAAGAAA